MSQKPTEVSYSFLIKNFIIIFLVGLVMYLPTVRRTIGWYNSGELTAAAITVDVPHPPGYPLFTRLANMAIQLFDRYEPAYTVNLLTALFGVLAAALLANFMLIAGYSQLSSMFAAILLLTCKTFWQQSILAEVYTLEICFILLGLTIGKLIEQGNESRPLAFFTGLIGVLGVGHRPTFGIYALTLFFFIKNRKEDFKSLSTFLTYMSFGMLAGFAPSLDLYVRLQSNNRVLLDPLIGKGIIGFLKVFTGAVYKGGLFVFTLPEVLFRAKSVILFYISEATPAILLLPAYAMFKYRKHLSAEISALMVILAFNTLFIINYNAFEAQTMLLPSLTALCILSGIAVNACRSMFLSRFTIIVLLTFTTISGYYSLSPNDYSSINYVNRMTKILPKDSVLMLNSDVEFRPFWYLRLVARYRQDISVQLIDDIESSDFKELDKSASKGRLYGSLIYPKDAKEKLIASFSIQSLGYVCAIKEPSLKEDKIPNDSKVLKKFNLSDNSSLKLMKNIKFLNVVRKQQISGGDVAFYNYHFEGTKKDFNKLLILALIVDENNRVITRNNILVGHDIHFPSNYTYREKGGGVKRNFTDSIVLPYDLKPGKYKLLFTCCLTDNILPQTWKDLSKSNIEPFNVNGYLEVFALNYGLSYRNILRKIELPEFKSQIAAWKGLKKFTTIKEFYIN